MILILPPGFKTPYDRRECNIDVLVQCKNAAPARYLSPLASRNGHPPRRVAIHLIRSVRKT